MIREIIKIPHPVLRQKCKKIRKISPRVLSLAFDMSETLIDCDGVGLSANQIGVPVRMFLMREDYNQPFVVMINPEIILSEGERTLAEGCLSSSGTMSIVKRFNALTVAFTDLTGDSVTSRFTGLGAQVVEHELDHLNGKMYFDKEISR